MSYFVHLKEVLRKKATGHWCICVSYFVDLKEVLRKKAIGHWCICVSYFVHPKEVLRKKAIGHWCISALCSVIFYFFIFVQIDVRGWF